MVVITDFRNMFWGVTLDGGKRYSQTVERSFHISMAALEPSSAKGPVSLMIQHEKAEFMLCTLDTKALYQQTLDLNFTEGEEVTLFLSGSGIVHLTGYLVEDEEDVSEYMQSMNSDDYESPDTSEEEPPDLVPASKGKKTQDMKRKLLNAFTAVPVKKNKGEPLSDSDESSDPDYEANDEVYEDVTDGSDSEVSEDEMLELEEGEDEDESEEEEDNQPLAKQNSSKKSKHDKEKHKETPRKESKLNTSKQEKLKDKDNPSHKPKASTPKPSSTSKSHDSETPKIEEVTESGDASKSSKKKKKKKKKNKAGEEGTPSGSKEKSKAQTPGTPQTPATTRTRMVAGGTQVEDIRVGHGPEAKPGKMVHLYYSGKLASGKQFDSCTSGKPLRFRLGKNEVIKGWDNGVAGMKVGGKRRLTVPAQQGYGSTRQGPIPPNSTLLFEVELKAVS